MDTDMEAYQPAILGDPKRHVCMECGRSYPHASGLHAHMKRHVGVRTHVCTDCGRAFFDSSNLRRHYRTHSGEKLYKCDQCNQSFSTKYGRDSHVMIHRDQRPYPCDICGRTFRQPSTLQKHRQRHASKPHSCPQCMKLFLTAEKLKAHFVIHTDKVPFKCNTCGKGFLDAKILKEHEYLHSDKTQFLCSICGKGYASAKTLKSHMYSHPDGTVTLNDKPHHCPICRATFKHLDTMKIHLTTHEQNNKKSPLESSTSQDIVCDRGGPENIGDKTTEKPFGCDICLRRFGHAEELKQHQWHHADKPHMCQHCLKLFSTAEKLDAHAVVHMGGAKYKCDVCSQAFVKATTLWGHMKMHSNEHFLCPTCGKSFPRKGALKIHQKVHSEQQSLTCPICGSSFKRQDRLRTHVRQHVQDNDPYNRGAFMLSGSDISENVDWSHTCKLCNTKLKTAVKVTDHLVTHAKYPYLCSNCDRGFHEDSQMEEHTRFHLERAPHLCVVCGDNYHTESVLVQHVVEIHSLDKAYICCVCVAAFSKLAGLIKHTARKHVPSLKDEYSSKTGKPKARPRSKGKCKLDKQETDCEVDSYASDGDFSEDQKSYDNSDTNNSPTVKTNPMKTDDNTGSNTKRNLTQCTQKSATCIHCNGSFSVPDNSSESPTQVNNTCSTCLSLPNSISHCDTHRNNPYHALNSIISHNESQNLRYSIDGHLSVMDINPQKDIKSIESSIPQIKSDTAHISLTKGISECKMLVKKSSFRTTREITPEPVVDSLKPPFDPERPHICRECGKGFRHSGALCIHRKKHKGIKPHKCTYCRKDFYFASQMRSHVAFVHTKTKQYKTFTCSVCGKVYKQRALLQLHMISHEEELKSPAGTKSVAAGSATLVGISKLASQALQVEPGPKQMLQQLKSMEHQEFSTQSHPTVPQTGRVEMGVTPQVKIGSSNLTQIQTCLGELPHIETGSEKLTEPGNRSSTCMETDNMHLHQSITEIHRKQITSNHPSDLAPHEKTHADFTPHVCADCGKAFTRLILLTRHRQSHKAKWLKCEQCDQHFADRRSLTKHQRRHVGKRLKCAECDQDFADSSSLSRHRFTHRQEKERPYICDVCNRGFTVPHRLKEHKLQHLDKPYMCTQCLKLFSTPDKLQIHSITHTDQAQFKCHVCSKGYLHARDLRMHSATHTSERHHLCPTCGKGFKNTSNLAAHMVIHNEEKAFSCPVCNNSFHHSASLRGHLGKHISTGSDNNVQSFPCPLCNNINVRTRNELINHLYAHSINKVDRCGKPQKDQQAAEKVRCVCFDCGKSFVSQNGLAKHRQKVHKTYECAHCSKIFMDIKHFKEHVRVMHPKGEGDTAQQRIDDEIRDGGKVRGQKLACNVCSLSFTNKIQLQIHAMEHGSRAPFICSHCDRGFIRKDNLQRHIFTHRDNSQRCHVCEVCNQGFMLDEEFRKHMATHGENPHKCEKCQACFLTAQDFQKHKKLDTNCGAEKSYKCQQCNSTFYKELQLRLHVSVAHKATTPDSSHTRPISSFTDEPNLKIQMSFHNVNSKVCETKHIVAMEPKAIALQNQQTSSHPTLPILKAEFSDGELSQCEASSNLTKRQAEVTYPIYGPNTCGYCGTCFRDSTQLQQHIAVHTVNFDRENIQESVPCSQVSSTNNTPCDTEMRERHHVVEAPQDYSSCVDCVKGFYVVSDLIQHLANHVIIASYVLDKTIV